MLEVLVAEETQAFNVQIAGRDYEIETARRRAQARRDEGDQFVDGRWLLRAPLTGVVVDMRTAVGEAIAQGDVLLVVEAMKMLNELRSRVAGTVVGDPPGEGPARRDRRGRCWRSARRRSEPHRARKMRRPFSRTMSPKPGDG